MREVLIGIELLSGLGLIIAILLHSPKGDGLAGIGGQAKLYNNPYQELEAPLNRLTYALAGVFMVAATVLGLFF